jgi:hypothetical protein
MSYSKKLFCLALLITSYAGATPVLCQIRLNGSIALTKTIQTKFQEKTPLPPLPHLRGVSAYITENSKNVFLTEIFIASNDVRIYSQGILKSPTDQLIASFWGRDLLIEVGCSLAKRQSHFFSK